MKCHRCGSSRHLWRDCPQRRPPDETPGHVSTSSVVTQEESEASTCDSLHKEWTVAEHRRLSQSFQITGSVGPLYYAHVKVCGQPVEAVVDLGSSATIMSFDVFRVIGRKVGDVLQLPDVILRDYNQRPIRVGAMVEVEIEFNGKSAITNVYLHSDQTPGVPTFLLGTNVITCLGIVTVAEGVEIRGGVQKTSLDDSISVAPVNLVRTERVPGQCGVVLRGQVQGVSDGELLYFQTSCTLLSLDFGAGRINCKPERWLCTSPSSK